MLEVLVSDIDRYELLSNREELLVLASAIVGNQDVVLRRPPPRLCAYDRYRY